MQSLLFWDFPCPGPFSARFTAEKRAIGSEIAHPMRAVGDIPADDPGEDFLFAKHFEHFLRAAGDRSTKPPQATGLSAQGFEAFAGS